MSGPGDYAGAVSELARLLEQCSPERLHGILASIEGRGLTDATQSASLAAAAQSASLAVAAGGAATRGGGAGHGGGYHSRDLPVAPQWQGAAASAPSPPHAPVPPLSPPPGGAGRRRAPPGVRRLVEEGQEELTLEELKRVLAQHSAAVLAEIRRMLEGGGSPTLPAPPQEAGSAVDMGVLAHVLAERDHEVRALEARLEALQAELAVKDQHVAELGGELDATVREVRHKQLDLEFQQLKLEERIRGNAELEQTQRNLMVRVEEASLNARHAALDLEMARSGSASGAAPEGFAAGAMSPGVMTPRGALRAQGSLPWTLRNRGSRTALGEGQQ